MAVMQMRKIGICGMNKDRPEIMARLQQLAIVQLTAPEAAEGFDPVEDSGEKEYWDKVTGKAEAALRVLEEFAPQKKSPLASLEGKRPVTRDSMRLSGDDLDAVLKQAEELSRKAEEVGSCRAEALRREDQITAMQPWMNADIPLAGRETVYTAVFAAMLPPGVTAERILASLPPGPDGEEPAAVAEILSEDRNGTAVLIACMKEDRQEMEAALRGLGMMRPPETVSDGDRALTPKEACARWSMEIAEWKKRETEAVDAIRAQAASRENLEMLSDIGRERSGQAGAVRDIAAADSTFIVTGYAPAAAIPRLEREIRDRFGCILETEEVDEEDPQAPTMLHNNHFAETTESVVASYGLPALDEIDPTAVMSFFYVFFFGMMLSDAAYGALIVLGTGIALLKFPRMEKEMQKTLRMFLYCGISTVVWGVLFGGYFGDAVEVISETFLGHRVSVPALWFVPLNNPMRLLLYSMLFGVIHLFTGLGIKGWNAARHKRWMELFSGVLLWYVFLIGLILMLLPTKLFAGIAGQQIMLPALLERAAAPMALIGLAGIILFAEYQQKNPVLRLVLGLYDVYGVTGWLSDVLSYSRLLALGLATGVIASVINQMGAMAGRGILGAVIFLTVFVAGHVLNMAINILGAYVHTNRLQYVEFFGKFYEGSGRPFEPYGPNTRYVEAEDVREGKR